MTLQFIQCPCCHRRVVPTAGICPSCRESISHLPWETANDGHPIVDEVPVTFQNAPPAPGVDSCLARIREIDSQFSEIRATTLAEFGNDPDADREAAERLTQELLTAYAAGIKQLEEADEDVEKIDNLETRRRSWQCLAAALLENDATKLQRHVELWEQSEIQMMGELADRKPMAKPDAAQHVLRFQEELHTYTPHLIVSPALVGINVLVFIAMLASGVNFLAPDLQDMLDWGADFGPKTLNGQWWRAVTCMFLHFGIIHLGFNMWLLWDLGQLVERLAGNIGFLVLYLASGIAGSLASLAWDPHAISAGASGAVFGVAGALLGLLAFRHDSVPTEVLKELRASMGAFLAYNVFFGITHEGIDNAAHLGGLTAGFACGLMLSQPIAPEMIAGRKLRNAAVVATFAIALPLAVFALPDAPVDLTTEFERIIEIEEQVLKRNSELWAGWERGALNNAEFAAALQSEILPAWTNVGEILQGALAAPDANRDFLSKLVKCTRLREESWQLTIEALQTNDDDKHQQADAKWLEAETLIDELE